MEFENKFGSHFECNLHESQNLGKISLFKSVGQGQSVNIIPLRQFTQVSVSGSALKGPNLNPIRRRGGYKGYIRDRP